MARKHNNVEERERQNNTVIIIIIIERKEGKKICDLLTPWLDLILYGILKWTYQILHFEKVENQKVNIYIYIYI